MATGAAATGADRHGSIGGGGGGGGGGNGRRVSRQESMPTQHTSQWIIDGDELPRADIEVRCALIGMQHFVYFILLFPFLQSAQAFGVRVCERGGASPPR